MVDEKDVSPLPDGSDSRDRLTVIRDAFGADIWDNSLEEITRLTGALALYSVPAFMAATELYDVINHPFAEWGYLAVSTICFLVGAGMFYLEAGEPGSQDDPAEGAYTANQLGYEWPWTVPPSRDLTARERFELDEDDIQILLTEYEQIGEAVRYRDGLLNRTVYFGLAIVGVVVGSFGVVSMQFRPVTLLVLSVTTFLFAMATMKYKDARDLHWKRQRDLERLIPEFRGRLTVFHTNRTAERRGLDRFSLTSFIISIYLSAFVLTTVAYVGLASLLPFM